MRLRFAYQDYPSKKVLGELQLIKETPVEPQILEDLERHVPLEKQFEDDGYSN